MYQMPVAEDSTERRRPRSSDAPLRRCIVSGDTLPRERLIRFVVGPDDIVVPDLAERLPGRGLWLTGRRDIVAQACATNAFRRAARRTVTPLIGPNGETLAALVDDQLAKRCLEVLGLARRAGQVTIGFDQVRAALKAMTSRIGQSRSPAVLLTAHDAAADGRDKLTMLASRVAESGAAVVQLGLFDAKTLGGAVGRDRVVHALVETDTVGERLYAAMRRLEIYRGTEVPADVEGAELLPSDG